MTCSRVKVWRCCTRCAAQAEAAPPTMADPSYSKNWRPFRERSPQGSARDRGLNGLSVRVLARARARGKGEMRKYGITPSRKPVPLVGDQDFERYAHGTGCQWPWMPVLTAAALVQEEALTVWSAGGRMEEEWRSGGKPWRQQPQGSYRLKTSQHTRSLRNPSESHGSAASPALDKGSSVDAERSRCG